MQDIHPLLAYEQKVEIFDVNPGLFLPIHDFYYTYKSLLKYWYLTKDFIAENVHKNSKQWYNDDYIESLVAEGKLNKEPFPLVGNGFGLRLDTDMIPMMHNNLHACLSVSALEVFLLDVCREIYEDYESNLKGSKIQQSINFIKTYVDLNVKKEWMKTINVFVEARNSFLHEGVLTKVSENSISYLNSLTHPVIEFNDFKLENVHIELLHKNINYLVHHLQEELWKLAEGEFILNLSEIFSEDQQKT